MKFQHFKNINEFKFVLNLKMFNNLNFLCFLGLREAPISLKTNTQFYYKNKVQGKI